MGGDEERNINRMLEVLLSSSTRGEIQWIMSIFETIRQKFGYYIKSQKQPVRGAKNSDRNIQRVEVNRGEWQEINKECLKLLYQEIVGRVYY